MKGLYAAMALVGLLLGLMVALQFRMTRDIAQSVPVQRAQELSARLAAVREEREALEARVDSLRQQLDAVTAQPELTVLRRELEQARILAGVVEVKGPGVEVTLNDSNQPVQPGQNPNLYVLHDEDVLKVLNELRAAGAEALAINGQRLGPTSEIRCVGPTILTNKNKRLVPPFVITAIGNPDTMISALRMRGGVVETLQVWGIQVTIRKLNEVTIPAGVAPVKFEFAQPVTS